MIEATTVPKAMVPAYGSRPGKVPERTNARGLAIAAPPTAPERTPIREIPICTVERNRFGESANSSAERAPLSPASARSLRLPLRAETSAVSDMAKRPLSRIKSTTIVPCTANVVISETLLFVSPTVSHRERRGAASLIGAGTGALLVGKLPVWVETFGRTLRMRGRRQGTFLYFVTAPTDRSRVKSTISGPSPTRR